MKSLKLWLLGFVVFPLFISCREAQNKNEESQQLTIQMRMTAKDLLGNPDYQAISYGGYREKTRKVQPTIEELKEDMRILRAMGVRLIRTYNVHLPHASNVLRAIRELQKEDRSFEMYVMLGAWIDCENAWTPEPNHEAENIEANTAEIQKVVELANTYPEIVKIIAVGNEAMVHWAGSYYVRPGVILKWVRHLQALKEKGELPKDLWITSSDDYASWGGGDPVYHHPDLEELIRAVDFISMHTYPYHNTHYNPDFWGVRSEESGLSEKERIEDAMDRALNFAAAQYRAVSGYVDSLGVVKPIHIGETGWASVSDGHYGPQGSRASNEFKSALYHERMRAWTKKEGITCFYFEAFDEPWKDALNPKGSENHFGLFTVDGKAKYAMWDLVDRGVFKGLSRNGNPITKTYDGSIKRLMEDVDLPPVKNHLELNH